MSVDKKTQSGSKRVVFVSRVGVCGGRAEKVSDADMLSVLSAHVAVVPNGSVFP